MASLEQIIGTVTKFNDRGFQISEHPGTWYNISKFAEPTPEFPLAGQRVQIGLDVKGFVREITVVDEATPANSAPSSSAAASSRGAAPRDVVSTRLECLRAAAEFLASRPDAKSPDVLTVAAAWEAWALRS